MTYRDILELYKTGKLNEEQKKQVEAELEKQQAISEFLYEQEDVFSESDENAFAEDEARYQQKDSGQDTLTKVIRGAIRKAFLKMGAVVTVVVLVILLLAQTVLPKLVDSFYYDPTEKVFANESGENPALSLETCMDIYSELFLPQQKIDSAHVTELGYGNYEFTLYQSVYRTGTQQPAYAGNIRKSRISFYDPAQMNTPVGNVFEWTAHMLDHTKPLTEQIEGDRTIVEEDGSEGTVHAWNGMGGDKNMAREIIGDLQENRMYRAYITLDRMQSYEDARAFALKKDLGGCWYAVETGSEICEVIGMYDGFTGGYVREEVEDYPYLFGYEEGGDKIFDELDTDEKAAQHFTSMLRFLQDQKVFSKMMDVGSLMTLSLQDCAEYVEQNGLRIYGLVADMDKDDMLELLEDDAVYAIGIEGVE